GPGRNRSQHARRRIVRHLLRIVLGQRSAALLVAGAADERASLLELVGAVGVLLERGPADIREHLLLGIKSRRELFGFAGFEAVNVKHFGTPSSIAVRES